MLKHQNDVKQFIPVGVLTTMAFVFVLIISSWLAPQSFSEGERLRSVLLQIIVVAGTPLLVVRITGLKLQNIFNLRLVSSFHFFLAILLATLANPFVGAIPILIGIPVHFWTIRWISLPYASKS